MFFQRALTGIFAGLLLFLICYPIFFKKNSLFRNFCISMLFVYSGAVTFLTMIYAPPWNWNISKSNTEFALSCISLKPFANSIEIFKNCQSKGNYSEFIRLVGGNFAMLMPLGILVPLVNKKFRFWSVALLGAGVSLSIELLQLSTNILLGTVLRTVEIDDFIQNTLGCIFAYIIFAVFKKIYQITFHKNERSSL